jgi:hypothetical protein
LLGAQNVTVSVWSSESETNHSLQSLIAFQSRSRESTDAYIHVYEDIPAQQISEIKVAAPSGHTVQGSGDSVAKGVQLPPSMDQEAEALIVNPLKAGAETISSSPGSNIDFVVMTQLFVAVKPKAYRIASGVTGTDDLESVAFRNPDGTHVLFTVNHSKLPVSLEAFWKDRVFTYVQAGKSIAIFAWDPKSKLISLVPSEPRNSAKGSFSVEARCSNASPVGIDLRCESQTFSCSIFPVRFTCNRRQENIKISVSVYPADENDTDPAKPGFVTITAAPDAGEPTSIRVPCCSERR